MRGDRDTTGNKVVNKRTHTHTLTLTHTLSHAHTRACVFFASATNLDGSGNSRDRLKGWTRADTLQRFERRLRDIQQPQGWQLQTLEAPQPVNRQIEKKKSKRKKGGTKNSDRITE